jgi:hypothetical protein
LICGSVVNVEKRLTRDGNDSRFSDLQLSAGSQAKRELWVRPTENNFAKLTPSFVWFCRYLSHNDPWLVGRRFIVHADERLSAFVELERQVLTVTFYLESIRAESCQASFHTMNKWRI